jgi:bifunctional DNA-binding transcriptional regulator/antitoxin component of YhaV-PrlF toxin-antitoxin module
MTVAVKNNNKTPLVVPTSVRRKAGFKSGQELEIKASGGVITILPKLPNAGDEHSTSDRRAIDAELAKAERGPLYGPFNSADEMVGDLKGRLSKSKSARKTKPSR